MYKPHEIIESYQIRCEALEFERNNLKRELPRLQSENAGLKKELREITEAITDPAVNLTLTAAECVKKAYAEVEQLKGQQEPSQWNQVQICTWIGNQLMTQPSMFERKEVCRYVRSLGRSEILAKHLSAPPDLTAKVAELEEDLLFSTEACADGARRISELTEQVKVAREAITENHEWHKNYDEHDGYGESDLCTINTEALAKLGVE